MTELAGRQLRTVLVVALPVFTLVVPKLVGRVEQADAPFVCDEPDPCESVIKTFPNDSTVPGEPGVISSVGPGADELLPKSRLPPPPRKAKSPETEPTMNALLAVGIAT